MRLNLRPILRPLACCLALAVLVLAQGCTTLKTHRDPKADLTKLRRIYVENRLGDDHALDEIIVRTLSDLGYEASSGPLTLKPDNVDAIIFYDDRWTWDFRKYLIAFDLTIKDGRRGVTIASTEYYRPSPFTRAHAAVIKEVVTATMRPPPTKAKR